MLGSNTGSLSMLYWKQTSGISIGCPFSSHRGGRPLDCGGTSHLWYVVGIFCDICHFIGGGRNWKSTHYNYFAWGRGNGKSPFYIIIHDLGSTLIRLRSNVWYYSHCFGWALCMFLQLGYDYLFEAQTNLNGVMQLTEILREMKDDVLGVLKEFQKATQLASLDVERPGDIVRAVGVLFGSMEDLKDLLDEPLREIDSSLIDGQETCVDVHSVTEEISFRGLQVGVGLLMTIVPTLLLVCLSWTVLHGNTRNATYASTIQRLRSCVLWPIFVVLVIACIAVGCAISIGGLLNADFCSGGADKSPDSTIIEIMNNRELDPDSFKYRAVEYLVRVSAHSLVYLQK